MKIKVCGLNNYDNVSSVIEAGADLVGFVFHKGSPRYFNSGLDFDEIRALRVKKVGVFVNEGVYSVLDKVAHYDLDFVQLHGEESVVDCVELKKHVRIIKSFGIDEKFDFNILNKYANKVDYFLFDTATPKFGGSGKIFNHQLLQKYKLNLPFFLSGGISLGHSQAIKELNIEQMIGVDINSKFEISPGIKNVEQVKQFIEQVK